MSGELKPTDQQLNCIEQSKIAKIHVIQALAGTGKTSTLSMVADNVVEPSLLLVFNRSAKEDAENRFPRHVEVRTTHSLAYEHVGHIYRHKLSRPKGEYVNVAYTGGEIARKYCLPTVWLDENKKTMSFAYLGLLVRKTVENFEQSKDLELNEKHTTQKVKDCGLVGVILPAAQKLWKDRKDLESDVLITHDTYMKIYQLSDPVIPHKVIYLDEAQDTSACTLDIVLRQENNSKIVLVGDKNQSIYKWRGSINAMEAVKNLLSGTVGISELSKSFRFGPEVARVANRILELKGESPNLEGFEEISSVVGMENVVDYSNSYTILYRTNVALIFDCIKHIQRGKRVNVEVDTSDLCKMLYDARKLYEQNSNKQVKHESLLMYDNWKDFCDEADANPELSRIKYIVENNQVGMVTRFLDNHKNVSDPDIIMTTAHKSKGREWDQVVLADDFPSHYVDGQWNFLTNAEYNLLYVACTRGRKVLQYNDTINEIFHIPTKELNLKVGEIKALRIDKEIPEVVLQDKVNKLIPKNENYYNALEDFLDEERGYEGKWEGRYIKGAGGESIDTYSDDARRLIDIYED